LATPYLFEDALLVRRPEVAAQNALLGASLAVPADVLAPFVKEQVAIEVVSVGAAGLTPAFATALLWLHPPSQKKIRLLVDPALSLFLLERALGGPGGSTLRPLSEAEEGILCAISLSVAERVGVPLLLLGVSEVGLSGAALSLLITLGGRQGWGIVELEPGVWLPDRSPREVPLWALLERKTARLIVGKACLTQEELASLLPSDTLLPDELTCDQDGTGLGCLRVDNLSQEVSLNHWQGTTQGAWMEDASKQAPPSAALEISIELGRMAVRLQDLSQWQPGTILPINKSPGDPVELVVSGKVVARGEIVRIENELGVRLSWIAK
jgi:hypothetical protein